LSRRVLAALLTLASGGAAAALAGVSPWAAHSVSPPSAAHPPAAPLVRSAELGLVPCGVAPVTPGGYWIPAVRADVVAPPATTPAVAVLDTGIDPTVPELSGAIVAPLNLVSPGRPISDPDAHGTLVAGLVAARPGKVRGVSPSSPIMPIRVLDRRGEAPTKRLAQAIDAAVAARAGVINISATLPARGTAAADVERMRKAIDRAFDRGTLVVAAAGNEGSSALDLPSALPHVISVGASDDADRRAVFSNRGPSIDLLAPGAELVSVAPRALCADGYASAEGTSFSAPLVAGAAALLAQAHPDWSAAQRMQALLRSARDVGPVGRDDAAGFGILDVAAALAAPAPTDDPGEVDDDVAWITGRRAAGHPLQLSARVRRRTLAASASLYNDPVDVYRVRLARGDRLSARLGGPAASRLGLSLWSPATRGLDISRGRTDRVLAPRDPRRRAGRLATRRLARGGTYFVAVRALRADGPSTEYTLALARR